MNDKIAQERVYLLERSEAHRRLAAESADEACRALHQRFVDLYRERAEELLVEEN